MPLKMINPSDKPVTLRRSAKVADVDPHLALENLVNEEVGAAVSCCSLQVSNEQSRPGSLNNELNNKFSNWLKGHSFTAWADNNPLTHILTKPKLDASEQRWVAKFAAYEFDIKYVPCPKNTAADALSRTLFARSRISRRLKREPYDTLLAEVERLSSCAVQDLFRSITGQCVQVVSNCQKAKQKRIALKQQSAAGAISSAEVSAVLNCHVDWSTGPRTRASPCRESCAAVG